MSHADRFYLLVTIFLLVATIAGGILLYLRQSDSQPAEIALSQTESPVQDGVLYIGGAVANPGVYTWQEGDTLQAILSDAGVESDADLTLVKIYIPRKGELQSPQKIDINRAEPWLLEALPGIGKVLAQRIVDYRNAHGSFKRIEDLVKVSGIGQATLDKIKDFITVSD